MKRSYLTRIIVFCVVFFLLAIPAHAYENPVSGNCGMYANWKLDRYSGLLEITGTGAMKNYETYCPWYDYREEVRTVVISDGITEIGDYAFYLCKNLEKVTIPDSVTRIGQFSFSGCQALTEIDLPDALTTIDRYAFNWCTAFTSVKLPDSVVIIGEGGFDYCKEMQAIQMSRNLKEVGDFAFSGCNKLVSFIYVWCKVVQHSLICRCIERV